MIRSSTNENRVPVLESHSGRDASADAKEGGAWARGPRSSERAPRAREAQPQPQPPPPDRRARRRPKDATTSMRSPPQPSWFGWALAFSTSEVITRPSWKTTVGVSCTTAGTPCATARASSYTLVGLETMIRLSMVGQVLM